MATVAADLTGQRTARDESVSLAYRALVFELNFLDVFSAKHGNRVGLRTEIGVRPAIRVDMFMAVRPSRRG